MLSASQITKIRNGLAKAFGLLAGDSVTHVTKAGKKTTLYSIMYDWDEARAEGLFIDEAGTRDENERYLLFENSYLTTMGVSIAATDTYEIGSEVWQMSNKTIIRKKIVPIAGIQNFTWITIRRAVELNTDLTGTITYTP